MTVGDAESIDHMVARLRAEGVLDEESIQYLVKRRKPEGQVCILPGETEGTAVSRLQAVYGWSERQARMSLAIARGESDIVPIGPMTDEERRESGIDAVFGDDEDIEAQEEARMISVGER